MELLVICLFLPMCSVGLHYVLFAKNNLLSCDEKIHLLYIDAIRKNKHKFIFTCDSYLVQKQVSYPQFIHWCLSFFSHRAVRLFSKFFPLLFSLLSPIGFCLFAIKIYHYINPIILHGRV